MTQPDDVASSVGLLAFAGGSRIAAGETAEVAAVVRRALDEDPNLAIVMFDRQSGKVIDLDLRGTDEEVRARYGPTEPTPIRRGRPKLGVVPREVTLLPRHWDWLARQPGGASIALRKLVEAASKAEAGASRQRTEAAYRFMSVVAGDLPGFEEATRALFAGDGQHLADLMASWPSDIGDQVLAFLDQAAEGRGET